MYYISPHFEVRISNGVLRTKGQIKRTFLEGVSEVFKLREYP